MNPLRGRYAASRQRSSSLSTSAGGVVYEGALPRSDTFEFMQLWQTVRQRYRFILCVALAVFAVVMAATLVSRMRFRSVGRLYLGELEGPSGSTSQSGNEIDIAAGSQGVVGSELEIIQSRSLVTRAILDSGLNVDIQSIGHTPPRYGAWLLSRRDPALLDVAAEELSAKNATLGGRDAREQRFTIRFASDSEYAVWQEQKRLAVGRLGEPVSVSGATLTLLRGSERSPRKGAEYALTILPLQVVADSVLKTLVVTAPKPAPQAPPINVVTLEFSATSPRLAASFLNGLIAAYLDERQSWKVENATAAEAFVTNQLTAMRTSLDAIQQKLADYRTNNRVVVMDNEAKAMIEQIGKYEEQRVAARLGVAALSEIQRTLKGPNPPVGAFLLGEANDSVLAGMAESLSSARQKLTELENRFNDAAPDVRAQRLQVDSLLESIRNYVSSRAARAQENLSTLNTIIGQYEARLRSVPGAELGLLQLSRESDVYSRTYSYLLERQQQAAIIKASTLSKNRVLDAPQVAYREDSPRLMMRLASAPLGLLFGVLLVLLRSFLVSTLQTEADARGVGAGLPIFASVPRRLKHRRERRSALAPLDVLAGDTVSSFAEAFRTLRTNLYRARANEGGVILLTAPNPGAGTTTCTCALAAIMAADGKRVLVVDADLRKASAGPQGSRPGLRELLNDECAWEEASTAVDIAGGRFFFMGRGGSAPAELLSGSRMKEFLRRARERYDFVLLDVASFPMASDALVLSSSVDCVVSVFRLASTSRKAALEHLRDLTPAATQYGILVNDVGVSRAPAPPTSAQRGGPTVPVAESELSFSKAVRRGAVADGSQA